MEDRIETDIKSTIRDAMKDGNLNETAGRRKIYLTLEKDSLYEYEKRMLTESGCPYTLSMYFINEEESIKAYYDFTGFIPLVDYINDVVSSIPMERGNQTLLYDALKILSNLLESLNGIENYLLLSSRMKMSVDTIFINSENKSVAFSYVPEQSESFTLQNRIIGLTEEMKHLYKQTEVDQYLGTFTDLIKKKNLGLDGMISTLGTIQREVSCIYWNVNDFRRTEENEMPIVEDDRETEEMENNKDHSLKKPVIKKFHQQISFKPLILQMMIILVLITVYLLGALDIMELLGLVLITGGADLWLMRKLHYI